MSSDAQGLDRLDSTPVTMYQFASLATGSARGEAEVVPAKENQDGDHTSE
jgi:hypothetical protein